MQRSVETQRAYEADWRSFSRWWSGDPLQATPSDIRRYLLDQYPRITAVSLSRHLAAIRWRFHQEGRMSPTDHPDVIECKQELARRDRHRSPQVANPINYPTMDRLVVAVNRYENIPKRERDRAILLTGWWFKIERYALAKLWTEDVVLTNGAQVRLVQRHKRGTGSRVVSRDGRLDPWDALEAWRRRADISEGPLWYAVDRHENIRDNVISAEAVSSIVKDAAKAAGMRPAGYSANSLRLGSR